MRGTRTGNLAGLITGNLPPLQPVPAQGGEPFGPTDWRTVAQGLPITKFFAVRYPGVKTHRDASSSTLTATEGCPDNHTVNPGR